MARIIKPICALDGPRRVSQYHTGPWIRNWTGLRPEKPDERWNRPDRAVARPDQPAPPVILRVPLTITLVGSTRRTGQEALHLVDDMNRIFMPAGVTFEVPELALLDADLDIEKLPNGEWKCPFREDVDHRVPCLHLGMVEPVGRSQALTLVYG